MSGEKRNLFWAFVIPILITLLMANISLAEEFNIDGYNILIDVRQDGNILRASGRVQGPDCKLLRVDIFVSDENGYSHNITIGVKNVDPGGRLMGGATQIYRPGNRWDITSIYAGCVYKH